MLAAATECLLPYQTGVRDYLKRAESEVWQWFASNRVREEQAESVRFELLKTTYRLKPELEPHLYEVASSVAQALDLSWPITIYQAQTPEGLNAHLVYLPDAIHLVLQGPIAAKLSTSELRALFAHELGHVLLYQLCEGELLLADEVIAAMSLDRSADASHFATARLFALYKEIFCDRIALHAVGSPADVIASLVKTTTGLDQVDATAYLEQAAEILQRGATGTEGLTHPEMYIRARALELWQRQGAAANPEIAQLIEGTSKLDGLDLLAQQEVMKRTRRLLDVLLAPEWVRTDLTMAHARLFFDDYQVPATVAPVASLATEFAQLDESLRDYYCYILLDFATVDRELEEAPLAHALVLADELGLHKRFSELALKELRLRKKQLEQIDKQRDELIAKARAAAAEEP